MNWGHNWIIRLCIQACMHRVTYYFFSLTFFFYILRSILTLPMEKNVPSLTLWHISCGLSGNLWDISTCTQWDEIIFGGKSNVHQPVFSPGYCFSYKFFASGMAMENFREFSSNPELNRTLLGSCTLVFGLFWCTKNAD